MNLSELVKTAGEDYDSCVEQLKADGKSEDEAHAICTESVEKDSSVLKKAFQLGFQKETDELNKEAYLAWGGRTQNVETGIGVQPEAGYTNILGLAPIPQVGLRFGHPDKPGLNVGIPYIGVSNKASDFSDRPSPQGLPDYAVNAAEDNPEISTTLLGGAGGAAAGAHTADYLNKSKRTGALAAAAGAGLGGGATGLYHYLTGSDDDADNQSMSKQEAKQELRDMDISKQELMRRVNK